MMHNSYDATSGYFGDLPYFGPVETNAFFESVASYGLHKLSEKLMTGPRTIEFFVKPDGGRLHTILKGREEESSVQPKGPKTSPFRFPTLRRSRDTGVEITQRSLLCTLCIKEAPSRKPLPLKNGPRSSPLRLDFSGVNALWSGLINHGFESEEHECFAFNNIDQCLADEVGNGELLLSLLLIGVSSISEFFDNQLGTDGAKRVKPVTIQLTVLADEFGKCMADAIQVYAEGVLSLSVERVFCEGIEDFASSSGAHVVESTTLTEWQENVRECATEKHERLCDEMDTRESSSQLPAPVTILIVPSIEAVREPLRKALLDSYSSEPIQVMQDISWDKSALRGKAPIMLLCSTSWVVQQSCSASFDRLLDKLNVKCVIHGGFCEYGTSLSEELTNTLSLLSEFHSEGCDVFIHTHESLPFSPMCSYALDYASQQQSCCVVLLMFRRFLMRYSPDKHQPYFSLPHSMFLSARSWDLYTATLHKLFLSGAVRRETKAEDSITVELTALGRFMTNRFRFEKTPQRHAEELLPQDIKAILWAHLFREARACVQEVIGRNYDFAEWVPQRVSQFCTQHNLDFQGTGTNKRTALIMQLARFGFSHVIDPDNNRVHYLLSVPSGTRGPPTSHVTGTPVTVSRGWYDQAPLRVGLSAEKHQVPVFCLPCTSLYCELRGPKTEVDLCIQCPTEISYPLIVAHSVLHISLHNNCVFLESATENHAVPLPLALLQSHTMSRILETGAFGEVGLWLDGVLADKTLAPSDPSMYRHMLLHKASVIGFCERNPFRRKRRRIEKAAAEPAKKDEFTGTRPRSAGEADTIEEFLKFVTSVGREVAEGKMRGKKGFAFLEPSHELHSYYLYALKMGGSA